MAHTIHSRPTRNRSTTAYRPADPLLDARSAAPETGRALSTFWRDVRRGLLPAPFYVLPRMPRWRMSELQAAVAATRVTPKWEPDRSTSMDPRS